MLLTSVHGRKGGRRGPGKSLTQRRTLGGDSLALGRTVSWGEGGWL